MGGGNSLHTFSAIFRICRGDLRRIDERQFVKAVLAKVAHAHYVRADRLSPLADLDRVLWHQDEAVWRRTCTCIGPYMASRASTRFAAPDGIDGDTTVSRPEYLADLAGTGRWKTLVTEVRTFRRNRPPPLAPADPLGIWLQTAGSRGRRAAWRFMRRRPRPNGRRGRSSTRRLLGGWG
jgi:hypothetical protein